MIDTSSPEPWEQLAVLRYELGQYNPELLTRPSAILANKMDIKEAEANLEELKQHAGKMKLPLFPISAQERLKIEPVLHFIRQWYDTNPTRSQPV